MASSYPEFSMFKELPAWGFYIRHANGINFENINLHCAKKDYRTAVVMDDVHGATFKSLKVNEPASGKNTVYYRNSTDVVLNKK
jgi:hypothetical protein